MMSDTPPNSSNFSCPAQKEWWDSAVFRPFYLIHPSNSPNLSIAPAEPLIVRPDENGSRVAEYAGAAWKDSGIPVGWVQGPMAHASFEGLVAWDHWHTDFCLGNHCIHVDYIDFFKMRPQTAYQEYRVFADNREIGRGGSFGGFLGGNFSRSRNWPLAIEYENYLIYLMVQPLHIGFSNRKPCINREIKSCSVWVK